MPSSWYEDAVARVELTKTLFNDADREFRREFAQQWPEIQRLRVEETRLKGQLARACLSDHQKSWIVSRWAALQTNLKEQAERTKQVSMFFNMGENMSRLQCEAEQELERWNEIHRQTQL